LKTDFEIQYFINAAWEPYFSSHTLAPDREQFKSSKDAESLLVSI